MDTFMRIVGGLAIIGVIAVCVLCAASWLMSVICRWSESNRLRALKEAKHDLARRMEDDAYWFSEWPEAQAALHSYANAIRFDEGVERARSDYRVAMKQRDGVAKGGE